MLARLLTIFPGWLTGRIGPRARRQVRTWTKNNTTLRTLQYGRFRRFLIWSTDHPVVFATLSGLAAAGIAYLTAMQSWAAPWNLQPPKLKADFNIAAYTGVPWGVQVQLPSPAWVSLSALLVAVQVEEPEALKKVRRWPSALVMETALGSVADVAVSEVLWLCVQALPSGPTGCVVSAPQVLR